VQDVYLNRITERYMKLCALNREALDGLFASISSTKGAAHDVTSAFSGLGLGASRHAPAGATAPNARQPSIDELGTVLQALRKLREAITASNRTDAFARRAYYFSIHVAVLCRDWESYVPALHSLLHVIHPRCPLPAHDLKDFVGLQILDQACRQADYAGARETKLLYAYSDRRVESVMRALVADDWVVFWRVRRSVDGYQRSVMGFAEARVRLHALKCLGRGYMSAERRFVERVTERAWSDLVDDGVGWELSGDGERVMIKRLKGT
jgi:hypothetical protein